MNPNPTGYPALQQHANPMRAAYPAQSASPSNQQFPFYGNAMPSYPQVPPPHGGRPLQQQPQHSFNPMSIQTTGPGGPMMPVTMSGPHANVPFSSPSPYPTATSIPTTATASPSLPQDPSIPPTTTAVPATSQNMAAFSNPNLFAAQRKPSQPPSQQPQAQAPPSDVAAQAQTAAREKARITALLDINSALLQEVVSLQAAGKAGMPPAAAQQTSPTQEQQSASPISATEPPNSSGDASKPGAQKPSQEYIECMRRLQANLAYLATIADRAKKAGGVLPAAPAIMTPPPSLSNLNEMYTRLNELFPGASRGGQSTPQGPQRSGHPSAVAVGETVV